MDMNLRLQTLLPEYENAYLSCHINSKSQEDVQEVVKQILEHRNQYEEIERSAGVPWWFAGILHYLEWKFQEPNRFKSEVIATLQAKKFNTAKTRTLGAYLWGFDLWNGFRDGAGDESTWVWRGTDVSKGTRQSYIGEDSALVWVGAASILKTLVTLQAIDIPAPKASQQLTVIQETAFKASTQNATTLKDDEKLTVAAGTIIPVLEDRVMGEHVQILIPDAVLNRQGDRTTWYVFKGHIQIRGNAAHNNPNDIPVEPKPKIKDQDRGTPITVPELGQVYLGDPIIESGNFSWAEATKNGARIPQNADVVNNIRKIANAMEEVRVRLGNRPVIVTSWYRDPITNLSVGGVSDSRHIIGDAVDFYVEDLSSQQVVQKLDSWWGSQGGLAASIPRGFTHIDARGYYARWDYP